MHLFSRAEIPDNIVYGMYSFLPMHASQSVRFVGSGVDGG